MELNDLIFKDDGKTILQYLGKYNLPNNSEQSGSVELFMDISEPTRSCPKVIYPETISGVPTIKRHELKSWDELCHKEAHSRYDQYVIDLMTETCQRLKA